MHLSIANRRQLYIAVAAAVHAAVMNKGRSKPQAAAHIAREHAEAAVREARISAKRGKRS